MIAFCCVFGTSVMNNNLLASAIFQNLGVGITILMLVSAVFSKGLIIMKSDRTYLLTLPIEKKELALNLFIAQIVAFFITNIFLYGMLIPFILATGGISYIMLPIDLIALTLLICSISVVASGLSKKMKIALGIFLISWTSSALWGFPFAPSSIFTGNMLYGSIVLVISAILSTAMALRELSNVEFKTMESLVRATSLDVKKIRTFDGMSPFGAVFFLNFSALKFSKSINKKSTLRNQINSIKLSWVMVVSCILGVVYVLLLPQIDATIGYMVITFLPVVLLYLVCFIYQRGMTKERAWLAFTSMDPMRYFRYISAAKALSLVTLFLPFVIANVVLSFLGFQSAITTIIPLLITIPCSATLTLYWATITNPVQFKEEAPTTPTQINLKQILTVIPFFGFFIIVMISVLLPIAGIIAAAVTLGLTLFLSYNRYPWRTFVEKLTENGYV